MDVGVSLRSGYGPDLDARTGARWMIERARAARDAGLDSLFLGDHHNVPAPYAYYQNVSMLGRLLAEWGERTAGALFLLPLWHPVTVAEQVGTLASIAAGPFVVQCALGAGAAQFGAFGTSERARVARFEAAVDVVRRLCAGEEVSQDTPFPIERAHISPVPPEPLAIWIGAAAAPAIERAARLGDGFVIGPEAPPADVPGIVATYRDACERLGRAPGRIAIRRDVHVGADDADAARVAAPVLARGYRGFGTEPLVVGGTGRVAAAFATLGEHGVAEVIVRHVADEQAEVLRSFERLAAVRAELTPRHWRH